MEVIKKSSNVEFDVIYADGTRKRVNEGLLLEAEDNAMTAHIGTSRRSVIFASAESILEIIGMLGLLNEFIEYMNVVSPSRFSRGDSNERF